MHIRSRYFNVKVLMAIIIVVSIAAVVIVSYKMDQITFSSDERDKIADACNRCHSNPESLEHRASTVHRIHTNAECMRCHVGVSGLETADNAHDVMEWVGIGIAGATVLGLGANYIVVKRRLISERKG